MPVGDAPKEAVSLRLDRDVISHFRRGGAGLANADERGAAEGGGAGVKPPREIVTLNSFQGPSLRRWHVECGGVDAETSSA